MYLYSHALRTRTLQFFVIHGVILICALLITPLAWATPIDAALQHYKKTQSAVDSNRLNRDIEIQRKIDLQLAIRTLEETQERRQTRYDNAVNQRNSLERLHTQLLTESTSLIDDVFVSEQHIQELNQQIENSAQAMHSAQVNVDNARAEQSTEQQHRDNLRLSNQEISQQIAINDLSIANEKDSADRIGEKIATLQKHIDQRVHDSNTLSQRLAEETARIAQLQDQRTLQQEKLLDLIKYRQDETFQQLNGQLQRARARHSNGVTQHKTIMSRLQQSNTMLKNYDTDANEHVEKRDQLTQDLKTNKQQLIVNNRKRLTKKVEIDSLNELIAFVQNHFDDLARRRQSLRNDKAHRQQIGDSNSSCTLGFIACSKGQKNRDRQLQSLNRDVRKTRTHLEKHQRHLSALLRGADGIGRDEKKLHADRQRIQNEHDQQSKILDEKQNLIAKKENEIKALQSRSAKLLAQLALLNDAEINAALKLKKQFPNQSKTQANQRLIEKFIATLDGKIEQSSVRTISSEIEKNYARQDEQKSKITPLQESYDELNFVIRTLSDDQVRFIATVKKNKEALTFALLQGNKTITSVEARLESTIDNYKQLQRQKNDLEIQIRTSKNYLKQNRRSSKTMTKDLRATKKEIHALATTLKGLTNERTRLESMIVDVQNGIASLSASSVEMETQSEQARIALDTAQNKLREKVIEAQNLGRNSMHSMVTTYAQLAGERTGKQSGRIYAALHSRRELCNHNTHDQLQARIKQERQDVIQWMQQEDKDYTAAGKNAAAAHANAVFYWQSRLKKRQDLLNILPHNQQRIVLETSEVILATSMTVNQTIDTLNPTIIDPNTPFDSHFLSNSNRLNTAITSFKNIGKISVRAPNESKHLAVEPQFYGVKTTNEPDSCQSLQTNHLIRACVDAYQAYVHMQFNLHFERAYNDALGRSYTVEKTNLQASCSPSITGILLAKSIYNSGSTSDNEIFSAAYQKTLATEKITAEKKGRDDANQYFKNKPVVRLQNLTAVRPTTPGTASSLIALSFDLVNYGHARAKKGQIWVEVQTSSAVETPLLVMPEIQANGITHITTTPFIADTNAKQRIRLVFYGPDGHRKKHDVTITARNFVQVAVQSHIAGHRPNLAEWTHGRLIVSSNVDSNHPIKIEIRPPRDTETPLGISFKDVIGSIAMRANTHTINTLAANERIVVDFEYLLRDNDYGKRLLNHSFPLIIVIDDGQFRQTKHFIVKAITP